MVKPSVNGLENYWCWLSWLMNLTSVHARAEQIDASFMHAHTQIHTYKVSLSPAALWSWNVFPFLLLIIPIPLPFAFPLLIPALLHPHSAFPSLIFLLIHLLRFSYFLPVVVVFLLSHSGMVQLSPLFLLICLNLMLLFSVLLFLCFSLHIFAVILIIPSSFLCHHSFFVWPEPSWESSMTKPPKTKQNKEIARRIRMNQIKHMDAQGISLSFLQNEETDHRGPNDILRNKVKRLQYMKQGVLEQKHSCNPKISVQTLSSNTKNLHEMAMNAIERFFGVFWFQPRQPGSSQRVRHWRSTTCLYQNLMRRANINKTSAKEMKRTLEFVPGPALSYYLVPFEQCQKHVIP